jgi:pimeloyl-ACP methyl ester carboxylesterase
MPHLQVKDAEIYYEMHGEGAPFLFCAVTGCDHQAWKFHQVPAFSRDHKVILFDYRGTRKSSKTIQKYSIKMFTADAAALLDHLMSNKRLSAATRWAESWLSCWRSITRTKSKS